MKQTNLSLSLIRNRSNN